ncbi:hypothetical protein [Saccharothrix yanglingensis]|uniref:Uncharacterized protein n=1 Tax=Saccharothrix yanglingensis TaxID=659496 RepID=A0ABU0X868_9PSEU|nr:hypothetical protein [Saccharothrix yanglingensis]MDQ2587429.1 hypothetical protein [Saccharothrix yanglingensis]
MTDPVVCWTTGVDGLADVVVREVCDADAVASTADALRRNRFAALAVAVAPRRLVVRTALDEVVGLTPVAVEAPCLGGDEVVLSAARSLYAWHAARLDLRALLRRGLPVWCAEHRAGRSAVACGRLGVALGHAEARGDLRRA